MTIPTPAVTTAIGLPPEQAIAHLQAKGAQVTGSWREWLDGQHARAFTVANVAKLEVLQDIQASLKDALAKGQTLQQWQDGLVPTLQQKGWWRREGSTEQLRQAGRVDEASGEIRKGLTPHRLRTIFATNMQSAYMAGRYQQMIEQVDERPFWQYVAVLDSRTRPAHRALNGKVFRYDDAAWGAVFPPNGFNCFLPGTPIQGPVKAVLKAAYAGPAVEVVTESGHTLRVTANHPILTARGWTPAQLVAQGDDLLCHGGRIDADLVGVIDHQQAPARVEDLFQALSRQGFGIARLTPDDLHGEARFVHGHVHVAPADASLPHGGHAGTAQLAQEFPLPHADVGPGVEPGSPKGPALGHAVAGQAVVAQDAADVGIGGLDDARNRAARQQRVLVQRADALFEFGVACARGFPGRPQLPADQAGLLLEGAPLQTLGLGAATHRQAIDLQDPQQRRAAEAELVRQLVEAGAGAVRLEKAVQVRQFDWTGHVYDVESASGLVMAGGIVAHNCRCRVRALSEREVQRASLTVDSSQGKLRQVKVPLKGGGEAVSTRYVDSRLPGGGFTPDPGFSGNPGRDTWQPRLQGMDVGLSRQYVDTAVAGPAFARFVAQPGPATVFPVAVLSAVERERLAVEPSVVHLTGEVMAQQQRQQPELQLQDYQRIPEIVQDGQAYTNGAGRRVLFLADGERVLRLVLDARAQAGELLQVLRLQVVSRASQTAEVARRLKRLGAP